MVRARRAQRRPARTVVPIVVVAVLIALLAVAWWRWPDVRAAVGDPAAEDSPSASTSAAPTAGVTSASPSATATESSSSTATAGRVALTDCRGRVRAGDALLAADRVGFGHWREHVDAQTKADDGRFTVDQMNAVFTRTRLAGPDDLKQYSSAQTAYEDQNGACAAPTDASTAVAKAMDRCADRLAVLVPALAAGDDAMADWASHQAAMRRSRMGHVHDAQGVWLKAWAAAPPHLDAFARADAKLADAPSC